MSGESNGDDGPRYADTKLGPGVAPTEPPRPVDFAVSATVIAPSSSSDSSPASATDYPELTTVEAQHYALGSEVARGGMGRILTARDRRLGRTVALKTLIVRDAGLAARFEREARLTAVLEHPAIVPIHEAGRLSTGEPFYTMKLVSGRPLDEVIAAAHTLEERLALLPRVIDIIDAIAYAHSHRVIHRDLKPANVLVGGFGETVVIDWGLAKKLGEEELAVAGSALPAARGGQTVAGTVMGTPAYMAPEQAAGKTVDESADVWALGAILHHLLTGSPPYTGRSSAEVLAAVQSRSPMPVDECVPGIPRDLATIVSRAMERDPVRRATARELGDQLRQFQTGKLVASHDYTALELLRRWIRRHRAVVSVSGVALVALLAIGAVGVRSTLRERDRADRERDVAVRERGEADRQRRTATELALGLLVEQGRQELASGNDRRAATLLSRAYEQAETPDPVLRLMMREAMRGIDAERVVIPGAVAGGTNTVSRSTLAVFTPDGKLLTSGANAVELWDPATGERLRSFELGSDESVGPEDVAFDPAGEFVVIGGSVLDLHTGAKRVDLPGRPSPAGPGCLLSDDGTRVALVQGVDTGIVADTRTGEILRRIEGGDLLRVDVACLSPDGQQITVSGQFERPDFGWVGGGVYDVASGRRVSEDHEARSSAFLALTHDRKRALVAENGGLTVVEADGSRTQKVRLEGAAIAEVAGFSADGALVTASGHDAVVHVWDARSGTRLADLSGHRATVNAVAFDSEARLVASAGDDNVVRVWDAATLPRSSLPSGTSLLAVSADGALMATQTGDDSRAPDIRDARTGTVRATLDFVARDLSDELDVPEDERPMLETIEVVAFLGETVLTRGTRGAQLWNGATGRLLLTVGEAEHVCADEAGRRFATYRAGGITIWSPTGERVADVDKLEGATVSRMRFSPDGALLAAATDGGVVVVDGSTGSIRWSHRAADRIDAFPRPFLWSESGARLVTPAGVHDANTGAILSGGEEAGTLHSLMPDGARALHLVLRGDRRSWEVRDVASGAMVYVLPIDRPVAVAFVANGVALASLENGHISLWDLALGRLLAVRSAGGILVSSDPGDPADRRLWSRRADGTLARFDLPLEDRPASLLNELVSRRAGWRLAGGVLVPQ